jgi:hypothetical protein
MSKIHNLGNIVVNFHQDFMANMHIDLIQCGQKIKKEFRLNFGKKVAQNTKTSTSKLNLKAQNIHLKLLLKALNKP